MRGKTVVVGMSGGVDSSVTALLLKQQGYTVVGMFMRNWDERDENGVCQATEDFEDVVRVCETIGIPYYGVSFAKEYWDNVFDQFLSELKQGLTPNPDILCNREIKFKMLLDKARELGGEFLATGHYCQTGPDCRLYRGLDPNKDQSYFLYTLKEKILNQVLFPIGGMLKPQVRALAETHKLATSKKKDSTGICFIGKRNFKQFISQYLGYTPGNFENTAGDVIGKHDGVAYYTIGQRKGLAIGGPGDAWFVVGKDVARNVVIIEQGQDHPALYYPALTANEVSWVGEPPSLPFRCTAKIRYRQADQHCTILQEEEGQLLVKFDTPQRAITPRQSVVFYSGTECLGGAMILKTAVEAKKLKQHFDP